MLEHPKIAISGARGFVARNLRKLLSGYGIATVCLSRRNFRTRRGEQKIVTADYTESGLVRKLRGCSAFIHLAGIGRQQAGSEYTSVNVRLTGRLVELCHKSGIRRFVFNSGLGASAGSTTDYFISKYAAERVVVRSGLSYTIFRPSYILGTDDYLTRSLKRQARSGGIIIPGSGRFQMQPIHIDDACKVLYQSVSTGRYHNKTIDLVGPRIVTYRKLVSAARAKKIRVSLEEAYGMAIRDPRYAFGVDDLNILVGGFVGDYTRLKRISGLDFSSYTDALKASGLS